jgi:hypothetical protein
VPKLTKVVTSPSFRKYYSTNIILRERDFELHAILFPKKAFFTSIILENHTSV